MLKNKLYGIYKCRVEEDIDPQGQGRIRVRVDETLDKSVDQLYWAKYGSPFGGSDLSGGGFFFPPPIGTIGYIFFAGGFPENPVFFLAEFYPQTSVQDPKSVISGNKAPFEATSYNQSPGNKIIKIGGHSIEFDTREVNDINVPTTGFRFTSALGHKLHFSDTEPSVILKCNNAGSLEFTPNTTTLFSPKGGYFKFVDSTNNRGFAIQDCLGYSLSVINGTYFCNVQQQAIMTKDFTLDSSGEIQLESSGNNNISGGNINLTANNNVNIFSGHYGLMYSNQMFHHILGSGASYFVELPAPNLLNNITYSSNLGSLTFRVGPNTPNPVLPTGTFPSNPDLGDVSSLCRISLGGALNNITIEGKMGGMFISSVPIPLPGSATPIPIYLPNSAPVPIQPAVLGANLTILLNELVGSLNAFFTTFNASSVSLVTPGTGIVNPAVVSTGITAQAILSQLQTVLTSPNPSGILSQVVFVN